MKRCKRKLYKSEAERDLLNKWLFSKPAHELAEDCLISQPMISRMRREPDAEYTLAMCERVKNSIKLWKCEDVKTAKKEAVRDHEEMLREIIKNSIYNMNKDNLVAVCNFIISGGA